MLHLTILTVLPSIGHCMALSLQINNDIIYSSYNYHKAHVQCMVYNEISGIPMALKLELTSLLSGIGIVIVFT